MRLESCARQFSIRTIAPTRRWGTWTSWNSQAGKICGERRRRAFPTSVFIRGDALERIRAGCTLFRDEARWLREPPCDYFGTRFTWRGKPSSDVSRARLRRHKQSTRELATTSTDLECVTKWVDILDSTPDLIHVHWFHVFLPASHCTLLRLVILIPPVSARLQLSYTRINTLDGTQYNKTKLRRNFIYETNLQSFNLSLNNVKKIILKNYLKIKT